MASPALTASVWLNSVQGRTSLTRAAPAPARQRGRRAAAARRRKSKVHRQSFARGVPTTQLEVQDLDRGHKRETGTLVRFLFDKAIFNTGCSLKLR